MKTQLENKYNGVQNRAGKINKVQKYTNKKIRDTGYENCDKIIRINIALAGGT